MYFQNIKKLVLIFSLIVFTSSLFAQSDYYSGTDGMYGTALKAALHDKIKGHTEHSYTTVWSILKDSDEDPNNSNNVILLYSGRSQSKNTNGGNANDWNREHVWAKSHGDFDTNRPAGTDAHHLRPTDVSVNSSRGNLDFDYGGTPVNEAPECNRDSDSWEPRDEVKGDVARMMLYMTVRYEGDDTSYDLELVDYIPSSGSKFGKESVLLEWNRLDPVSAFERRRNREVYKYQKNYNPFIDHPEYADRIHNSDKLIVENAEQVGNNLHLTFSKPLNTSNAEVTNNYQIDFLGNPTSVTTNFGGDSKKVSLSFSQGFVDTFYNVRVTNLTSTTGEAIIPNSIALFIGSETVEIDSVAPSTPSNLMVTSSVAGDEINLNWDSNPEGDISHYSIYRGALANFTPSQWSLVTTTTNNSYTDKEIFDYRVYYKISAVDLSGNESDYSDEYSILVSVDDEFELPNEFSLKQNYPNPFNPSTTIEYSISNSSDFLSAKQTTLKVYNILGVEIATLVNEIKQAGSYSVKFSTSKLSTGIYLYTLTSGSFTQTKKMIVLK